MPGCIVNSSTRTESASTTVKTMVMPDYVRSGDRPVTTAVTTTPGVMMALTLTMVAPALMMSACVTAVVGVVVSLTVVAPPLMTCGGGGGGIGTVAAAVWRFWFSTSRRSLSANGGMMCLRAVATFSSSFLYTFCLSLSLSYASRSCFRLLCIYRPDNKRHTCLITVSNIILTCISTGYGRSDRVCHIENPLHFPKPLLQRYDNPTQDMHDKTGRRYVILIFL